jgi:hypothetical protein
VRRADPRKVTTRNGHEMESRRNPALVPCPIPATVLYSAQR